MSVMWWLWFNFSICIFVEFSYLWGVSLDGELRIVNQNFIQKKLGFSPLIFGFDVFSWLLFHLVMIINKHTRHWELKTKQLLEKKNYQKKSKKNYVKKFTHTLKFYKLCILLFRNNTQIAEFLSWLLSSSIEFTGFYPFFFAFVR